MAHKNSVELDGTVTDTPWNLPFIIALETGQTVKANPPGRSRMNFIPIRVGDKVTVRISSDFSELGRIISIFHA